MTTNRILTTLVQLALLVPAVIGVRAMWEWLKEDVRELTRQTRRVDLTMSRSARSFCAGSGVSYGVSQKNPRFCVRFITRPERLIIWNY